MRCDMEGGQPDEYAVNGDEGAFGEIHLRNRGLICAAALEMTGRTTDAEDAHGVRPNISGRGMTMPRLVWQP
jgi:hypothetical protein